MVSLVRELLAKTCGQVVHSVPVLVTQLPDGLNRLAGPIRIDQAELAVVDLEPIGHFLDQVAVVYAGVDRVEELPVRSIDAVGYGPKELLFSDIHLRDFLVVLLEQRLDPFHVFRDKFPILLPHMIFWELLLVSDDDTRRIHSELELVQFNGTLRFRGKASEVYVVLQHVVVIEGCVPLVGHIEGGGDHELSG